MPATTPDLAPSDLKLLEAILLAPTSLADIAKHAALSTAEVAQRLASPAFAAAVERIHAAFDLIESLALRSRRIAALDRLAAALPALTNPRELRLAATAILRYNGGPPLQPAKRRSAGFQPVIDQQRGTSFQPMPEPRAITPPTSARPSPAPSNQNPGTAVPGLSPPAMAAATPFFAAPPAVTNANAQPEAAQRPAAHHAAAQHSVTIAPPAPSPSSAARGGATTVAGVGVRQPPGHPMPGRIEPPTGVATSLSRASNFPTSLPAFRSPADALFASAGSTRAPP